MYRIEDLRTGVGISILKEGTDEDGSLDWSRDFILGGRHVQL